MAPRRIATRAVRGEEPENWLDAMSRVGELVILAGANSSLTDAASRLATVRQVRVPFTRA